MLLNTKELIKSLTMAKNYSEKKDSSLITANVFFMQENNKLVMKASNNKVSISIPLDAVGEVFNFDVKLIDLLDYAKGCINEDIKITVNDNKVLFESGEAKITLNMFELTYDTIEDYMQQELERSSVAKVINETIVIPDSNYAAIDKNNPKHELTGLLIDLRNKKIVSTDTRRLSIADINIDYKGIIDQVIIPKQALQDAKEISNIRISQNYISFDADNKKIICEQIIGKYPEYFRIIPREYNFKVNINGIDLKNTLKKIKSNDIELNFFDNKLKIIGENNSSISIECYYPSKNTFSISAAKKYILDAVIDNELELCFNEDNIPFTVNNILSGSQTVIMPIATGIVVNDIFLIKDDFHKDNTAFIYKQEIKKRSAPVNKDKIIKDLRNEVAALQKKLEEYEDKKSIVKNAVFNNIFNAAQQVSL